MDVEALMCGRSGTLFFFFTITDAYESMARASYIIYLHLV